MVPAGRTTRSPRMYAISTPSHASDAVRGDTIGGAKQGEELIKNVRVFIGDDN